MGISINTLAKMGNQKLYHLDIIANNLANVNTPGFKALRFYLTQTESPVTDEPVSYSKVDFRPGIFQKTENVFDLAIEGEGFFVVETKKGRRYTRAGNFTLTKDGRLVTSRGEQVLGEKGPISIQGRKISVSSDGSLQVDGVEVDRLMVVNFEIPQALKPEGDGLYAEEVRAGLKKLDTPRVKPGELELSNVEAIREMVEMIEVQRSFETYQKIIQVFTELDKLSTGRIGKLVA